LAGVRGGWHCDNGLKKRFKRRKGEANATGIHEEVDPCLAAPHACFLDGWLNFSETGGGGRLLFSRLSANTMGGLLLGEGASIGTPKLSNPYVITRAKYYHAHDSISREIAFSTHAFWDHFSRQKAHFGQNLAKKRFGKMLSRNETLSRISSIMTHG
jgi:hypothetical protein